MKQPTNLQRLEQLVRLAAEGSLHSHHFSETELNNVESWLQWTLEHLTERNLYHKKQQIKRAMMVKLATSLLSKDELTEVDKQAEEALNAGTSDGTRGRSGFVPSDDIDQVGSLAQEEDSDSDKD